MLPSRPAQLLKAPVPPAAICRSNWLPCTSQPETWNTTFHRFSMGPMIHQDGSMVFIMGKWIFSFGFFDTLYMTFHTESQIIRNPTRNQGPWVTTIQDKTTGDGSKPMKSPGDHQNSWYSLRPLGCCDSPEHINFLGSSSLFEAWTCLNMFAPTRALLHTYNRHDHHHHHHHQNHHQNHHLYLHEGSKFATPIYEQYVDWGNSINYISLRDQNSPPPMSNMLIGVITSTLSSWGINILWTICWLA